LGYPEFSPRRHLSIHVTGPARALIIPSRWPAPLSLGDGKTSRAVRANSPCAAH